MRNDINPAYDVGDIVRVVDLSDFIGSGRQFFSGKCVTIAKSYVRFGMRFYKIVEDNEMFSGLRDDVLDMVEINDSDFWEVLNEI